jgi:hypothetical protein
MPLIYFWPTSPTSDTSLVVCLMYLILYLGFSERTCNLCIFSVSITFSILRTPYHILKRAADSSNLFEIPHTPSKSRGENAKKELSARDRPPFSTISKKWIRTCLHKYRCQWTSWDLLNFGFFSPYGNGSVSGDV